MNAMNQIVVSAERVSERLACDMRLVLQSSVYPSVDEKIEALDAQYKNHMFVHGVFSSEKNTLGGDELFFVGKVCDLEYRIRLF